ncbi:hypothetical protein OROHE_018026 [Orobanche hederae]
MDIFIKPILGFDICADTLVGDEMLKGISGDQKKRLTTAELLMDPETYEMFDDIILFSEGQIVYQGPHEAVNEFFLSMGFKCPSRKIVADFIQEVLSENDQEQYWFVDDRYSYVHVVKFVEGFHTNHVGNFLKQDLVLPYDKSYNHPVLPIILIMMSVFFRTTMHPNTLDDGGIYLGALYFAIVMILFNGFMEVPMSIAKLPVFYKHRDLRFYPCWVYTVVLVFEHSPFTC